MFSKLSLLVLVAPLISALTMKAPEHVSSGGFFTVEWTVDSPDTPVFSVELAHPMLRNSIAILNNVDPSAMSQVVQCPILDPMDGYSLQAVNISDINMIYAQSPTFAILPVSSSSGSLSSTAAATGTGASTTLAGTVTSAHSLPATTSTGVTPTGTSPSTTGAGTGAGTGTGTGTAASTTPSSAATSSRLALTTVGGYAVLVLSAVAGAAAVAF